MQENANRVVLVFKKNQDGGWSWHVGGGRRVSSCEQEASGLEPAPLSPLRPALPTQKMGWGGDGEVGVSWDTHF